VPSGIDLLWHAKVVDYPGKGVVPWTGEIRQIGLVFVTTVAPIPLVEVNSLTP
jgi:hypothetical protein